MALPLTLLHQMKMRRVGTVGNSQEFDSAFVEAANLVMQDISNATPSLSPNLISSSNDDTGLEPRYLPMISSGLDYYMSVNSQFKREGTQDLFQLYQVDLLKAATYDREDNSTLNGRRGVAVG